MTTTAVPQRVADLTRTAAPTTITNAPLVHALICAATNTWRTSVHGGELRINTKEG